MQSFTRIWKILYLWGTASRAKLFLRLQIGCPNAYRRCYFWTRSYPQTSRRRREISAKRAGRCLPTDGGFLLLKRFFAALEKIFRARIENGRFPKSRLGF